MSNLLLNRRIILTNAAANAGVGSHILRSRVNEQPLRSRVTDQSITSRAA